MAMTQVRQQDEHPLQEPAPAFRKHHLDGTGPEREPVPTPRYDAPQHEGTMNEQHVGIAGKTATSSHEVAAERDFFLELWAAKMLARRRLGAVTRTLLSDAKKLAYSEIGAANARATLMLAAVFACVGLMISLLEQVMPAWRAALVTSVVMATLGFALLQERWVTSAACVVRNVRREAGRRELARVRVGSR